MHSIVFRGLHQSDAVRLDDLETAHRPRFWREKPLEKSLPSLVPSGKPFPRIPGRLDELNTFLKHLADLAFAWFRISPGWSFSSPTSCLLPQQKQGPRASAASRPVGTTTPRYGDNPALAVQAGGMS
jgi:hypothetical protein